MQPLAAAIVIETGRVERIPGGIYGPVQHRLDAVWYCSSRW
ncbi:hypothetical protein [Kribbella sp. C-35]